MKEFFYAEDGTDKAIRLKYFPDYNYKGTIVEVGAASPEYISNSRHFKINGWRAVHIEPNPAFVKQHVELNNEIYEYACGEFDADDVDFVVVSQNSSSGVTDHSFSSFEIKDEYLSHPNLQHIHYLNKKKIKVKCRKLDTIIDEANIDKIDVLSVDTEGWEIEVMKGLTKIKPSLVILENVAQLDSYTKYMSDIGYKLDHIENNLNFFYIKK
jgi:FkbM family methyltransferase